MSRIYLADKQTLDTVNNKVGTANDAASATPNSLFAGIKQLISVLSGHIASWTSARANKIDNLDASMSSRAAASTALNKNTWTDARAGYLDRLVNGTYGLEAIRNAIGQSKNWYANGGTDITLLNLSAATSPYQGTGTAGSFTAPEAGIYRIDVNATITNLAGSQADCYLGLSANPAVSMSIGSGTVSMGQAFKAENLAVNASFTGCGTIYVYIARGQKVSVCFKAAPLGSAIGGATARINYGTVKYGKTYI